MRKPKAKPSGKAPRGAGDAGAYALALLAVFRRLFRPGLSEFHFSGADYRAACELPEVIAANGGQSIRNPPDVLYSFRSRRALPDAIRATAPAGMEWLVELAGTANGDSRYRFKTVPLGSRQIEPNPNLKATDIPNATPEIVALYALGDEQATLARVRYNRLVDVFLGIAAYSLQNHLKTRVAAVGQIEIDELYVGVDKLGRRYVVPVQAKGGKDRIHAGQLRQDMAYCAARFPELVCKPLAVQSMPGDRLAMFELTLDGDRVLIVDERHYRLAQAAEFEPRASPAFRGRRRAAS
jgi:hypothetical protein